MIARVVRWPQTLHVKATRIRRRGDLVKSDHGKVDTRSIPESRSDPAGDDGPSIPDPVVHPLTFAALRTSPIAASYKSPNSRLMKFAAQLFDQITDPTISTRDNESYLRKRMISEDWDELEIGIAVAVAVSAAAVSIIYGINNTTIRSEKSDGGRGEERERERC